MYKRAVFAIITILTCCALICVGFSAWSIVVETTEQFASSNGSLLSEQVIYSDDYVYIEDGEPDMSNFTVTKFGFSGGSYTGSFTVDFKINADNCKSLAASSGDKLHVQVILSFADNIESDVFNSFSFACDSAGVTQGDPSITAASFTVNLTLDFKEIQSDSTVQGTFTFSGNNSAYKTLYDALGAEETTQAIGNPFNIVVMVTNEVVS